MISYQTVPTIDQVALYPEQGQYQPLPTEIQVPIIYAGVNGLVSNYYQAEIVRD